LKNINYSYSNLSKAFTNCLYFPKVFPLKCSLPWSFKNEIVFIKFLETFSNSLIGTTKKCALSSLSIQTQIADLTGISWNTALKYLQRMYNLGWLSRKGNYWRAKR